MGYLGEDISKLGFGLMRLPMTGEEVDIAQLKKMVDLFIKKGNTYFDTAYVYTDGKSETAIKEALVDRYPRESFQLATKLPAWQAKSEEEAKQMFFTSLERTGAGYFDFYLLHNLGGNRTELFDKYKLWDFIKEQKKNGLIKHYGFSFHDTADKLDEILNAHPDAEFVQLQINYADWNDPTVQSGKCYETARKHGKPVIIMEPVKGGSLAGLPEAVDGIFKKADPKASSASWAIRYAASLEGIITVLSGMSTLEQMEDNTNVTEELKPLSDKELQVIKSVQKALYEIPHVPCTSCGYCVKNCPMHIAIPGTFKSVNSYLIYNNMKGAESSYAFETREGAAASRCIECGQCESVCPQHIKVIGELKKAAELFGR